MAVSRYWTFMHTVVLSCSLFEGGMHMVFSRRADKNAGPHPHRLHAGLYIYKLNSAVVDVVWLCGFVVFIVIRTGNRDWQQHMAHSSMWFS